MSTYDGKIGIVTDLYCACRKGHHICMCGTASTLFPGPASHFRPFIPDRKPATCHLSYGRALIIHGAKPQHTRNSFWTTFAVTAATDDGFMLFKSLSMSNKLILAREPGSTPVLIVCYARSAMHGIVWGGLQG